MILRAASWDQPVAHVLVAEIRHRAGRNAKHVESTTGVVLKRALVAGLGVALRGAQHDIDGQRACAFGVMLMPYVDTASELVRARQEVVLGPPATPNA